MKIMEMDVSWQCVGGKIATIAQTTKGPYPLAAVIFDKDGFGLTVSGSEASAFEMESGWDEPHGIPMGNFSEVQKYLLVGAWKLAREKYKEFFGYDPGNELLQ